ncbi:MAG: prepilin-type N-terminal cleavage/methylation domain-containing protein, partial [Phycisphaerae bacterium]
MRDRRSGFTLVETLVTLTIGTLLVAATVSATRALTTARAGVDRRTQRVAQARRAMEAIVAGLRNVSRDPPDNRPLIVGRSGGGGAGNDAISFLAIEDRRVRPEGAESDFHEMSFFLAQSGTKGPPRLVRRRDHAFDEHPEEGGI